MTARRLLATGVCLAFGVWLTDGWPARVQGNERLVYDSGLHGRDAALHAATPASS